MRTIALATAICLAVTAQSAHAGTLWANRDHKRSLDRDSQECRDKAIGEVHQDQTLEHILTDATITTAICLTSLGWKLTGFTTSRN